MSTQRNIEYALIKDNKVVNIIVFNDGDINEFVSELEIDKHVLLTDENFYNDNVYNKVMVGYNYYNETFYPTSWIKQENGDFIAPDPYPSDGRVYRWIEQDKIKWIPLNPYASWTWDEATQTAIAPVPYPEDGKIYTWDEESLSWLETSLT